MRVLSRIGAILAAGCLAQALSGCAGLQQFPEVATDYTAALQAQDPAYDAALAASSQPGADKVSIRNALIDARIRVLDLNFADFERKLAQENVTANFGVAVVQVVVGGAGALVSETASQILSATSGDWPVRSRPIPSLRSSIRPWAPCSPR